MVYEGPLKPSELLQDELITQVQSGELDLALTCDVSLSTEALRVERLHQLAPFVLPDKQHALTNQKKLASCELPKEPYVMFAGFDPQREYDRFSTG